MLKILFIRTINFLCVRFISLKFKIDLEIEEISLLLKKRQNIPLFIASSPV